MPVAPSQRLRYLDWLRGIAVLVMIQAHTFDSWTLPAARSTLAYRDAVYLGGFAAPLFLWLAGIGSILSAESALRKTGRRTDATALVCRRGLEIYLLAFLLRVQSIIVTPDWSLAKSLLRLFRIDILDVMGPAIVAVGVLWAIFRRPVATMVALSCAAAVIAVSTPAVRAAGFVERLPLWIQWHVRPAGEFTTFTHFPWSGFVFAGAAVGVVIARARETRAQRRLHAGLFLIGAALFVLTGPKGPTPPSFWTSSPAFFALRLGVLSLAVSLAYVADRLVPIGASLMKPLARFGQNSLFVYWIHMELVYGYASWPVRKRLNIPAVAIAYVAFCAAMYGAIVLRDLIVRGWSDRQIQRRIQATAAG